MWTGVLLLSIVAAASSAGSTARSQPAAECTSWQQCRDQVEAALAAESFERAHDLAWRAVQRGPKDDPVLMFLLARAQSMAGRPQDALVMIRRLAERGVPTDALTHSDLARVRGLEGWADVEALVARANAGAPAAPAMPASGAGPATRSTAPSAAAIPPTSAAPTARRERTTPSRSKVTVATAALEEAPLRFSTNQFVAAGLAYDTVSQRFVMGDQSGRKLRVVAEGLDHAIDLVRAESAGFLDVRALGIDPRRGDLWVATSDPGGETGTLHRLQLVSGRPLQSFSLGEAGRTVRPVDLVVADSGTVFVLDHDGRLLRARPGAAAVETAVRLDIDQPMSLALAPGDALAYVTHATGVVRVDLDKRSMAQVASSAELPLNGIERLRVHRDGFIALQRGVDGRRRLLRLELSRNGRAVRSATTYDVRVEAGNSPTACAVSGDVVSLVTGGLETPGVPEGASSSIGPPAELVVRRFRLR